MSKAVLLVGFGGPSGIAEVRPFLDKVLEGRRVTKDRYEEVVRQYEAVGGASPYNRLTEEMAGVLGKRLAEDGRPHPVYVGMRNTSPTLEEAFARMAADGVTEAAAVILSSFRSEPSWDRYVAALEAAAAATPGAPAFRTLTPWGEDTLFIRAIGDRIREAEQSIAEKDRAEAHWLFTAHSIPLSADHPSRYAEQIRRAAVLTAERAGHANWSLCFQSRSGRPEDPWLEPDVSAVMSTLSPSRSLEVVVIPVGFLLDHVEVLYDLDVKSRKAAEAAGLSFHRAGTVGTHPAFMELLSLRAAHALSAGAVR